MTSFDNRNQREDILRCSLFVLLCTVALLFPDSAMAIPGFLLSKSKGAVRSNATEAVLLHGRDLGVLTFRTRYKGPDGGFVWIVPIPLQVDMKHVRVLQPSSLDRLEVFSAPKLVSYKQRDPCYFRPALKSKPGGLASKSYPTYPIAEGIDTSPRSIVISRGAEREGLARTLRAEGYLTERTFSEFLLKHIAERRNFLVIRLSTEQLTSRGEARELPAIQVRYPSTSAHLPLSLSTDIHGNRHDMLIHIIGHDRRYEVRDHQNILAPTNLIVPKETTDKFSRFYEDLFGSTSSKHPGAFVTEYARDLSFTCDPCPEGDPFLETSLLAALGLDKTILARQKFELEVGESPPKLQREVEAARELTVAARKDTDMLKRCVLANLGPKSRETHMLNLALTIQKNGNPRGVSIPWDSVRSASLSRCIEDVVMTWKLDEYLSEETVLELPLKITRLEDRARRERYDVGWVMTRIRTRLDTSKNHVSLGFKEAPFVFAGDEEPSGKEGTLEVSRGRYGFQAKYLILEHFQGFVGCKDAYWRWDRLSSVLGASDIARFNPVWTRPSK